LLKAYELTAPGISEMEGMAMLRNWDKWVEILFKKLEPTHIVE
jgi:hypothetical protein